MKSGSIFSMADFPDYQFKVCLAGEPNVGKTSFINYFMNGTSDSMDYIPSIYGFQNYDLRFESKNIRLQIWDIARSECFDTIMSRIYKDALEILLIFDIINRDSFDCMDELVNKIQGYNHQDPFIIVIGNKIDLDKQRQVEKSEMEAFAIPQKIDFLETSAKTGFQVHKAFEILVHGILTNVNSGKLTLNPPNRIDAQANPQSTHKLCT
jgi:small GTP-binding protein